MTATKRRTGSAFARASFKARGAGRGALAGALVIAAVHAAPDTNAYCRTSSKTPSGWDETTQGCFDGAAVGSKVIYWRNACVSYNLQQDASRQVTLERATAVVASAFAGWHDVQCGDGGEPSLRAVDLGPVACGEVRYNKTNANQNVIVFRDDTWPHDNPSSTLGLTTVTFDVNTGELFGADMEINSTLPLIVSGPRAGQSGASDANSKTPVGYDLATIVTHEAGHFLGLAHSASNTAVMAAHYKDGSQLSDDDIAGICAAYPSDGRRPTTAGTINAGPCDPTPPHGFSSQCAGPATDPPTGDDDGGCAVGRLRSSHRTNTGLGLALLIGLSFFVRQARRAQPRPRSS